MSVVVFAGPTLGRDAVTAACPCLCLPPAAQGDVYRAALRKPRAIAIIDGYFHGVPAVWHKEILWAMAEGIHVFGASSMGALRAAELHDFGMRGVGTIFEQFLSGTLTDDDEVAVLHAPAEIDYAPLSEAMVNIRATLARAAEEGTIPAASAEALCLAAKAIFYQQRDWHNLLSPETGPPIEDAERTALRAWLPSGRIDQKRADALAMLAEVRGFIEADPPPMRIDYTFEWTHLWESVVSNTLPVHAGEADDGPAVDAERVLDELRLDPDGFREVRRAALLRLLAAGRGPGGEGVDRATLRTALVRFRAERALFSRQALDAWIAANGLDDTGFERLVEEEAMIEVLVDRRDLRHSMLDELRVRGCYPTLRGRARDKHATLASFSPGSPAGGLQPALHLLAQWFFESRLQRGVPDDLARFARDIGLGGRDDLARILTNELAYHSSRSEFPANPDDKNRKSAVFDVDSAPGGSDVG